MLCWENGLSVIAEPKPSRGSYGIWLGEDKPPTVRRQLEALIDIALGHGCKDFDSFLAAMKAVEQSKPNLLFGELEKACDAAAPKFNDLSDRTKAASARMKDISEQQRHIGTYAKTREVYAQYRKLTGRKQAKFYEKHTSEIEGCQAAKRYFDSPGLKKLPSMQSLKQEYAMLQAENKKRYPEYKQTKAKMIELLTAKTTWSGFWA